jgi:hypothetical protein
MRQTRHLEAVVGPGSEASCQGHELSLTTTCPHGQLPPSQWGQSPPDPMRQQNKWVAPMDPEVADLTAWVLIDLASGLTTTGSVTSARTAWRTRFKPITDDPMRVADQPCRITSTGGKMPWSDGGLNVCPP